MYSIPTAPPLPPPERSRTPGSSGSSSFASCVSAASWSKRSHAAYWRPSDVPEPCSVPPPRAATGGGYAVAAGGRAAGAPVGAAAGAAPPPGSAPPPTTGASGTRHSRHWALRSSMTSSLPSTRHSLSSGSHLMRSCVRVHVRLHHACVRARRPCVCVAYRPSPNADAITCRPAPPPAPAGHPSRGRPHVAAVA